MLLKIMSIYINECSIWVFEFDLLDIIYGYSKISGRKESID